MLWSIKIVCDCAALLACVCLTHAAVSKRSGSERCVDGIDHSSLSVLQRPVRGWFYCLGSDHSNFDSPGYSDISGPATWQLQHWYPIPRLGDMHNRWSAATLHQEVRPGKAACATCSGTAFCAAPYGTFEDKHCHIQTHKPSTRSTPFGAQQPS